MKRRQILAPTPPAPPTEPASEDKKPLEADINDADVFELPPSKTSVEPQKVPSVIIEEFVEPPTPAPKKKRSAAQYAHLAKAREKSIIARKQKKEERQAWESENGSAKDRFQYEQLRKKFGDTSPLGGSAVPPPAPQLIEQPPPSAQPSSSMPSVSRPTFPETTYGAPSQSNDPYRAKGSSQFSVDYDRIINGVRDTFLKDQEFMNQYEEDIRNDQKKRSDATYKDQMAKWEQDQHRRQQAQSNAYGALSGRSRSNNVFERTKSLQRTATDKYKNNWYNY